MKKYLAVLVLAVLFSVVAGSGVASATHTASDNPPRDFAVGSGHVPAIDADLAFSAISSGTSGQNPRGHYRTDALGVELQGPVTCLATAGNRAVLGGPHPTNPSLYVYVIVEDNGKPSEALPDRVNVAAFFPVPCQAFLPFTVETFPIERGDVIVHDAPDVTP
jgi:hypothetical protein